MKRYLLNSAVITTPGFYEYKLLSLDEAKAWLRQGEYYNTIGYEETCQAFNLLFSEKILPNRELIRMETGDEALVFRLTCRLPDPSKKGKLSVGFVLKHCEIGLLRKIK